MSTMSGEQKKIPIKAILGGIGGSVLEWYDFFLYGTAASLVFPHLFFPNMSNFAGLLLSYTTFATAFLSRPFGSMIFARIGDRVGRKTTLVITTLMMGIGTALMGVLPGFQSIGYWAPILLTFLRLIQGIALGGEWGGGMLLVTESAPEHKRGFYGSLPQMGLPIGLLLGGIAFQLVNPNSPGFLTFGWRIPFLFTIVLVAIVLFFTRGLEDSEEFTETKNAENLSEAPLKEVFTLHWRPLLKVIGTRIAENASYYVLTTYMLTYVTTVLGYSKGSAINATNIAAFITIFTIPFIGYLSDKIGKRVIYIFGSFGLAVFAFPYYYFMGSSQTGMLVMVTISLAVVWGAMYAVQGGLYSGMFPTEVRYTGMSFGYQTAGIIAGGPAPFIAAFLTHQFNSFIPIALYLVVIGVVSGISAILMKKEERAKAVSQAAS
ncbi:MFS transporter [Neobacillus sp. SM06]|uniref:MFS transporter n=1 Tax=Neobacillus sp. SM06 TaxID=3422492 RepID=UPI003D2E3742